MLKDTTSAGHQYRFSRAMPTIAVGMALFFWRRFRLHDR